MKNSVFNFLYIYNLYLKNAVEKFKSYFTLL